MINDKVLMWYIIIVVSLKICSFSIIRVVKEREYFCNKLMRDCDIF